MAVFIYFAYNARTIKWTVSWIKKLLSILVCPLSKAPLEYNKETQELICRASGLAYPIKDGIPVMLESEARHLDTDEKLKSAVARDSNIS